MKLEDYLKEYYSKTTAKAYKREIEIYLGNCKEAQTASHKDIVNHIGNLRNRYTNPKTINRILASIKSYYTYLASTGKRKDNPAKSIRLRDKQNRDIQLQDLFTIEELENLLNRKERYNLLTIRNKVLTSLLIYQALKPNELETITINEINLEQGTIHIKSQSKTNGRTLQLKPKQIMLLHQYMNEVRIKLNRDPKEEKLLIGKTGNPMPSEDITKHIKRSFKGIYSPRKVNCQTIRQSVITNLLKQGNDLRIVQVFAGHKNPGTTEKYKQSNMEALKTAIQQYHPFK